jgi:hypothetical protein
MFPTQMTSQMAQERGRDDRERASRASRTRRGTTVRWRTARTGRHGEARR